MDSIVLTMTGALMHIHARFWRKLLAALFGAACYCIGLCLPWRNKIWIFGGLMLAAVYIMGKLAFSLKGIRKTCHFLLLFHVSAFFVGGVVSTVYHYTRLGYYIRNAAKGDCYAQILAGILALTALAACMFGKIAVSIVKERRKEKRLYYEIELSKGEKKKKATALWDTGNHLREPVSKKPVILMDMTFAGELLDKRTEQSVRTFYKTGYFGEEGEEMSGIRLIPYHSIGKSHGLLAAVFLDCLCIQTEQKVICLTDVCAALTEELVTDSGKYQVILNAELAEL